MRKVIFALAAVVMSGCAAEEVYLRPGAENVKLYRKSDPPAECKELQMLTVTSGSGCAGFGRPGNLETAYVKFRNAVIDSGGNTGLVSTEHLPVHTRDCYANEHTITGFAYQCPETVTAK